MSTRSVTFHGKEADIGVPLRETITVQSNCKGSCTFEFSPIQERNNEKDMKHKLRVKPNKFVLERGESKDVVIEIKIFCTVSISDQIEVKATRKTTNFNETKR